MSLIDQNYIQIIKDERKSLKNLIAMHLRVENISSNKIIMQLRKIIEKFGIDDAKLCELILQYEAKFSDYQVLQENDLEKVIQILFFINAKDKQISKISEDFKSLEAKCNKLQEQLDQAKQENIKLQEVFSKTENQLLEQEKLKQEMTSLQQLIKKQELEKDYHKRQNQNYTSLIKQLQNEASENQNTKDQMFGELSKQVKLMKNQLENCETEYIQKLEKKEQEIKTLERQNLMLQKKLEMSEDFDQILSLKKKSPKDSSSLPKGITGPELDSDDSVESFHINETTKKQTPEKILETSNKTIIKTNQKQSATQLASKKKKSSNKN